MTARLAGKVAVVFGAGQTPGPTIGNGRAIATLFAREGARLICADRDLARAEETVAAIVAEGGEARASACDVVRRADCDAAIAAAADWGGVDIVVNNVGIGGGDGPLHRLDEAAFDRILGVNLKGTVNGTAAAVVAIRAGGRGGAIVNISSLAGIAGHHMIAYETSKAAVNRLTISTALANAKAGIRVNAIAPGLMDTPMAVDGIAAARGVPREQVHADRSARVPLGAMGTAWDTAYAALFLASDEARFVTGIVLPVDGGMGARIG